MTKRTKPSLPVPPEPEPEEPLTPREEKLAMLYAQGGKSLSACCREVGLHPDSQRLRERVRQGDIGQAIARRMRQLGLTLDAPLLKIREFYDAKKEVLNPVGLVLDDSGSTTKIAEVVELRDNDSQRWAVEQTLKLHGAYPKDDAGPAGAGPAAVNIVFTGTGPQPINTGIHVVTIHPGGGNGNGHRH